MVYVEKIKVQGKTYYKLVHALRRQNKITHKSRYLGKTLPPRKKLAQLQKGFLAEIASSRYQYLSPGEIEQIEQKKTAYQREWSNLTTLEKGKRLTEFVIRFTYDSSKLAGVPVTLRQTSLILKEGIIPKEIRSLATVKKLENHQKGVIAITQYRGPLTLRFIKKLHTILLAGVDDTIAGKTRDELQRNVKLAGTVYVPAPWNQVAKELRNFFSWYKAENRRLHPLELAALLHLQLITLQPFVDGNSRLSRLLMNWILWKKGYPPVNIPIEDLENYYGALDKYQIEKNERPFIEYIKQRYSQD
ncbi:MAG: Fic family protein [Nanoarchaeota archaeon]